VPQGEGGSQLTMTLVHAPTGLRFLVTAALGGGRAVALNLSLKVSLVTATVAAGQRQQLPRPSNVTLAFPYISGIAIGGNGTTNAGINHFSTGLCTDGSLPAWVEILLSLSALVTEIILRFH
jgi:hypothetical protein